MLFAYITRTIRNSGSLGCVELKGFKGLFELLVLVSFLPSPESLYYSTAW